MKATLKRIARACGLETALEKLSRWRWLRKVGGTKNLGSGVICQVVTFDDWLIFHEIFELKVYDRALESLLGLVPDNRPARIVDLGGNVGFFALALIDAWLRNGRDPRQLHIVSVEGSPRNCGRMRSHRDRNLEWGVDWQIIHGLAGKRHGADFISSPEGHYSFRVGNRQAGEGFRVEYVDLDAPLSSWEEIDLLKCDIEGSELEFLTHYPGLLSRTGLVCLEVHGAAIFEPVDSLLAKAGFDRRQVLSGEGSKGPSGETRTLLLSRSGPTRA
jgi:FkbM family methyltransferase